MLVSSRGAARGGGLKADRFMRVLSRLRLGGRGIDLWSQFPLLTGGFHGRIMTVFQYRDAEFDERSREKGQRTGSKRIQDLEDQRQEKTIGWAVGTRGAWMGDVRGRSDEGESQRTQDTPR